MKLFGMQKIPNAKNVSVERSLRFGCQPVNGKFFCEKIKSVVNDSAGNLSGLYFWL